MEPTAAASDSKLTVREQCRALLRMPSFVGGSTIGLFWLVCAVAPGLLTDRDALGIVRDSDGSMLVRSEPGGDAWFGTDIIGRDVFALTICGAENTVVTASLAAAASVVVGAAVGLMMGTSRRWPDDVLDRIMKVAVSFPVVIFVILVFSVYGASRVVLVATMVGLSAPFVANAVRSEFLGRGERESAGLGSVSDGAGDAGFVLTPVMSTLLAIELVERLRHGALTVVTLSFLGFVEGGGDTARADWGRDFANAYPLLAAGQWWTALFPALAMTSLVFAMNLIDTALDRIGPVRSVNGEDPPLTE